MIPRLSTWLVVALLGGVFVAGCGSSSSSTSTSTSSSQSSQSGAPAAATTSSSSSTVPAVASAAIAQAVAACKHGVQAASTLSASTRTKIEAICNKAASGDLNAAREAARQLCIELVNASPVPAGSAKEQALAACKK
jgi:hypothetical protein